MAVVCPELEPDRRVGSRSRSVAEGGTTIDQGGAWNARTRRVLYSAGEGRHRGVCLRECGRATRSDFPSRQFPSPEVGVPAESAVTKLPTNSPDAVSGKERFTRARSQRTRSDTTFADVGGGQARESGRANGAPARSVTTAAYDTDHGSLLAENLALGERLRRLSPVLAGMARDLAATRREAAALRRENDKLRQGCTSAHRADPPRRNRRGRDGAAESDAGKTRRQHRCLSRVALHSLWADHPRNSDPVGPHAHLGGVLPPLRRPVGARWLGRSGAGWPADANTRSRPAQLGRCSSGRDCRCVAADRRVRLARACLSVKVRTLLRPLTVARGPGRS